MQHINEEAGLSRQEAVPPLQRKLKAGFKDIRGVRLLESGAQSQEAIVDEQQLIPDTPREVGQQPAGVPRVPLLADPTQVTLKAARTVRNDGCSRSTSRPMNAVRGLRRTHMSRIAFDDIYVYAPGHWPHAVGHQTGVLRRLLNVVDLEDAAIGIEVLPHGSGGVRLEEHPVAGPTIAELGIPLDVVVAGGEAPHPQGVTALEGHARRIHAQAGR